MAITDHTYLSKPCPSIDKILNNHDKLIDSLQDDVAKLLQKITIEEFRDLQHVYVEQIDPATHNPSSNRRKLIELRALFESSILPIFEEDRRIHDLGFIRATQERQSKFPDVDFTNASPWLSEYNLDLSPTPSEYEEILFKQQDDIIEQLLGRFQSVVAEILETNTHG